jgi:hypothetical protein
METVIGMMKLRSLLLAAIVSGTATVADGQTKVLSEDRVIELQAAGLERPVIAANLSEQNSAHDLSAEDRLKLKKAGVPGEVIQSMLAGGAGASAAVGETGMCFRDKRGKWQAIPPEVIHWKEGGFWKNGFFTYTATVGHIRNDRNGGIKGSCSLTRITRRVPLLIIVAEGTDIAKYELLNLHQSETGRVFRLGTLGADISGKWIPDMTSFRYKRLASRLFEILLPKSIPPGEYGFLGPGASGAASSAQHGKMYTFSIIQ